MKIGELAQQSGLTASSIRYYEQEGLLASPKRVSGQRVYTKQSLVSLKLIQLAQAAGFSISEIKILISGYTNGKPISESWFELASQKQIEIEHKIAELQTMQKILKQLLQCTCSTVEDCVDQTSKFNEETESLNVELKSHHH